MEGHLIKTHAFQVTFPPYPACVLIDYVIYGEQYSHQWNVVIDPRLYEENAHYPEFIVVEQKLDMIIMVFNRKLMLNLCT